MRFVRYYQNPCVELEDHLDEVYSEAGRKEKEILEDVKSGCHEKWLYSTEFLESYALNDGR